MYLRDERNEDEAANISQTYLVKRYATYRISALEQKRITIHKKRGNLAMQICVQTTNCMITSTRVFT